MSVKMLLVFHNFISKRVAVSLWFIVSQLMFVEVYISVKVQLKCVKVSTVHLSFPISFIGDIHCTLLLFALWIDLIALQGQ